jgi:hypothetical protein
MNDYILRVVSNNFQIHSPIRDIKNMNQVNSEALQRWLTKPIILLGNL